MKHFVFPYSISFGKLDSVGGQVEHSLSEANAKRLIRSAEEGGRHLLSEDSFISDICTKVYKAVEKELTEQLMQDSTPVRDALSWDESYDPSVPIGIKQIREYIDDLMITVYYPEELQLLEAKSEKKSCVARYVITNEEQAAELIKHDSYENNVIILPDEGKTLYFVPLKFAGVVTVPATVQKIKAGFTKGAFQGRKSISEIIIESGLPEIEEWTFRGCEGLRKITIPGTVKKIGHLAFSGCSSLNDVILPEGLEEIYYSSFENCYNLESITLPSSLKLMYKMDIRDIYFKGKDTEITEKLGCEWRRTTLHVLPGSNAEKYAIEHGIRYVIMDT